MVEIESAFCPNQNCKDYGIHNQENIAFRGKYGKEKTKDLLYCRTCGQRFASTRTTAFFGLHFAYSAQLGHQFRDYSDGHSGITRPPDPGKLSQLNRSEATIDFQYSSPLLSINQYKVPVTTN